MAVRINAVKIGFSAAALALLIGALAITGSFGAANAGAADVFVPGRVYTVTGGKTTLTPTKRVIRKLKRAKVKVKPTGSARGSMRKLVFPVTGGRVGMRDDELIGRITHRRSGVVWGSHKPGGGATGQVRLGNPLIDLSRGAVLWNTRVGGTSPSLSADAEPQDAMMYFVPESFRVDREAGTVRIRGKVGLTKRGAKLFRSKLGLNVKKGTTLGIIGILIAYAGGDGQGGGIYN